MEWNGTEWKWIWPRTDWSHSMVDLAGARIGWRLCVSLSLSLSLDDDDDDDGHDDDDDDDDDGDDDDVILSPPTPIDTLVRSSRAYTRPLPRVTRVSSPTRGGGGGGAGRHGVAGAIG